MWKLADEEGMLYRFHVLILELYVSQYLSLMLYEIFMAMKFTYYTQFCIYLCIPFLLI